MIKIENQKRDKVVELYDNGLGVKAIAKEIGIHRGTVSKILQERGVWLKELKRPFKNLYDIKFFNSYTKESCYWAGFILADGNLTSNRKQLQIGLHKDDIGHLKKFSNAINFTGPIYKDIRKNGYESVKLSVSGKWFQDDLNNNFEIYNRKSLTAIFTNKIPDEFLSDFIRGYFDGDGSLSKSKSHPLASINFTGNYSVLNSIADIFENKLDIEKLSIYIYKKRKASQINYYGKKAKIILDWLYNYSDDKIRLNRKFELYEKFSKNKAL